jgi:hypothetical protein
VSFATQRGALDNSRQGASGVGHVAGEKLVDGAHPARIPVRCTASRLHVIGDWKLHESWTREAPRP